MRSSSWARPAVEFSEYSGLPVTIASTHTHTTGPIAASARYCTRAAIVDRRLRWPHDVASAHHSQYTPLSTHASGRNSPAAASVSEDERPAPGTLAPRARPPTRSARRRRCPGIPARRGSRRRSGSARAAPRPARRPDRSTVARDRYMPATTRDERGDRSEHHQPRAALAEDRADHPEGDRQRMLRRPAIDPEVGQVQVQQIAAPQQRVEGVVRRVGRDRRSSRTAPPRTAPRTRSSPTSRHRPPATAAAESSPAAGC